LTSLLWNRWICRQHEWYAHETREAFATDSTEVQ
jgi:hypothetical protein